MGNPILRGFTKLAQFSGRDSRAEFWPYAGIIIALLIVAYFNVALTGIAHALSGVAAFRETHPEAVVIQAAPGVHTMRIDWSHPDAPEPDLDVLFIGYAALLAAMVLLLGAAVARRLHDRGKSARWGLLPLPFLICAAAFTPVFIGTALTGETSGVPLFGLLFLNNLAGLVACVTLFGMLALRGTSEPNRHGPAKTPPEAGDED